MRQLSDSSKLGLINAITQLFTFLTFLLVARNQEPVRFGIFAAHYSLVMLFANLTDLGESASLLRDGHQGKIGKLTFYNSLRKKLIHAIGPSFLLIGLLLIWLGATNFDVIILSIVFFLRVVEKLYFVRMRWSLNLNTFLLYIFFTKSLIFVFSVLFFYIYKSVYIIFLGLIVSSILQVYLGQIKPLEIELSSNSERDRKKNSGFQTYSTAIAIQNMDIPLISAFGSAQIAGSFTAIYKILQPLTIIGSSIGDFMLQEVSKTADSNNAKKVLYRSFRTLIPLIFILVVISIFTPEIIKLTIGVNYLNEVQNFRVLVVAVFFTTINQLLTPYLQGRNEESYSSRIIMLCIVTHLILVSIFSRKYGVFICVYSFISTQLLCSCLLWLKIRRCALQ